MPITQADFTQWEQERDIEKFVQILRYLDDDQYSKVCLAAIKVLGRLRDTRGLSSILTTAFESTTRLKQAARDELSSWAQNDCESLCRFVENDCINKEDREKGLRILSERVSERVIQTYIDLLIKGEWIEAIQSYVQKLADIEPITRRFIDPDPKVRFAAVSTLLDLQKHPQVIPCYSIAIADPDVQVRSKACLVLSHLVYESKENQQFDFESLRVFIPLLLENLKHEDFLVRSNSVRALGEIQDPAIVQNLFPLLSDPFETVRKYAVFSLSQIPNELAFEPLKTLYRSDITPDVRLVIIHAIAKSLHSGAFGFLQELIENEKDKQLRILAVEEIGSIKNENTYAVINQVIHEHDNDFIKAILKALVNLQDTRSVDPLLELLLRPDLQKDRSEIFGAIGRLKQPKAIEALIVLLGKGILVEEYSLVIRSIKMIISPQSINDYLANLPASESVFYKLGVSTLKEKLNQR
ncbi:MAG: HEAT repeat domain-containing protein [Anaerolineaceae bacterium]